MAASLLERIPVDEITVQAREVHFWRTVLTVVAAVLFGLGWAAYKVFAVAWLVLAWTAVAVKVGWQESRKAEAVRRARVSRGAA